MSTFLLQKSVLHLDIKPENILVDSEGHIVVIDLDSALSFHCAATVPRVLPHIQFGTAGYRSPEQAKRKLSQVDPNYKN